MPTGLPRAAEGRRCTPADGSAPTFAAVPAQSHASAAVLRHLPGSAIDRDAWDACVQAAAGVPYAFSWYLDLVAEGRWDALVLDHPEGGYRAVFPLPWRRKLGIKLAYTPFFVQQLGVFARPGENNAPAVPPIADWLAAIPSGFRKVHLQAQPGDAVPAGAEAPKGWKQHTRLNLLLPLNQGAEGLARIQSGYGSNLKRNLNKARKAGLEAVEALDPEAFAAQFRREQGPQIPELAAADYQRMARILAEGLQREAFYGLEIRSHMAEHPDAQDAVPARLCFWKAPRGPLFLFGTSTENGRKTGAMALGFDHAIGQFCGVTNEDSGAHESASPEGEKPPLCLDFEGSTREGLARFYRGFGATEEHYPVWERSVLGAF